MAAPAAPVKKRGRGGIRLLVVLAILVLIIGGLVVGLNLAAQAATNVGATLTVFVPTVSVSRAGGSYAEAISGTVVQPGDSVKTDARGRGQIRFPDGTNMRMASGTEITLTAAHFGKDGNLHDVSILDKVGRTLSSVQHLAGGATFQVVGNSTTASVRGTLFEVLVNGDGSVLIKLFEGQLDVDGKNHRHLTAGQQVSIDPSGNVGSPGPITSDPNDPFSAEMIAQQEASNGTTPGTEQDFVGPPLHNGDVQLYTYSFAGGSDIKAVLAYPGSLMELKITGPDNHVYDKTGLSPIIITIPDPAPGIYKLNVIGKSGLDPAGESPYLSVAASEPCATANIEQNGAVRHAYTAQDMQNAVTVAGLSNLQVTIVGSSIGGAVLTGNATYNGVSLSGTLLLYTHGGNVGIIALAATAFGVNLPAQQATQQIASALGSDPSNVSLGYHVDRLFTCSGVLMIDGRTGQ